MPKMPDATHARDAAPTKGEYRERLTQRRTHTKVAELRAHVQAVASTRDAGGDQAGELIVEGYAAVFDQPSEVMSFWGMEFDERIARGAFTQVLAEKPDVRFMGTEIHGGYNFARTSNGSLELREDDKGLWFRAKLNPDVQAARDLYALIERGDVSQMSFGFQIGEVATEYECEHAGCDLMHDTIMRVSRLYEISAVPFPAYPQTSIHAASAPATDTDDDAARDASPVAERELPMDEESDARERSLRTHVTTWSKRWSTSGRSARNS